MLAATVGRSDGFAASGTKAAQTLRQNPKHGCQLGASRTLLPGAKLPSRISARRVTSLTTGSSTGMETKSTRPFGLRFLILFTVKRAQNLRAPCLEGAQFSVGTPCRSNRGPCLLCEQCSLDSYPVQVPIFNAALFSGGAWPFVLAPNKTIERIAILKFIEVLLVVSRNLPYGRSYPCTWMPERVVSCWER